MEINIVPRRVRSEKAKIGSVPITFIIYAVADITWWICITKSFRRTKCSPKVTRQLSALSGYSVKFFVWISCQNHCDNCSLFHKCKISNYCICLVSVSPARTMQNYAIFFCKTKSRSHSFATKNRLLVPVRAAKTDFSYGRSLYHALGGGVEYQGISFLFCNLATVP